MSKGLTKKNQVKPRAYLMKSMYYTVCLEKSLSI